MGSFWLIAAVMAGLAGAAIAIPLWRQRPATGISRNAINAGIFRERLAELDAERQEGRLDDQQYRPLREELERTLLADVPQDAEQRSRARRSLTVQLASVTALAMPLLALGYYYISSYRGEVNDWIILQHRLAEVVTRALQRADELPQEARNDLAGFTRLLQARLLREGMNDPDGLYLLGSSYLQLQRLPEALTVLERAYTLAPQRADILLMYAQAMILTEDERLSKAGVELLQAFLEINPNHQGALLLLGFGAFNSGAYQEAIQVWQRLLALRNTDDESTRLLRDRIARAEQFLASRREAKEPSESAPATDPQIAVTVDLAPALRMRLSPQDTLFIFARAADGPAMPLAVVRQPAQGFPVQVVLDDSQAMTPSMKLSNFQQVVVGARISKAGNVAAQAGDLQSASSTLSLQNGAQSVSLIIDQVIQ